MCSNDCNELSARIACSRNSKLSPTRLSRSVNCPNPSPLIEVPARFRTSGRRKFLRWPSAPDVIAAREMCFSVRTTAKGGDDPSFISPTAYANRRRDSAPTLMRGRSGRIGRLLEAGRMSSEAMGSTAIPSLRRAAHAASPFRRAEPANRAASWFPVRARDHRPKACLARGGKAGRWRRPDAPNCLRRRWRESAAVLDLKAAGRRLDERPPLRSGSGSRGGCRRRRPRPSRLPVHAPLFQDDALPGQEDRNTRWQPVVAAIARPYRRIPTKDNAAVMVLKLAAAEHPKRPRL